MANLRDLKKDIDFVCGQLVIDTLIYVQSAKDADVEKAQQIVNDALTLDNEMRVRANHPDGKNDPKKVRAYYKSLAKDLVEKVNAMYDELNKLA